MSAPCALALSRARSADSSHIIALVSLPLSRLLFHDSCELARARGTRHRRGAHQAGRHDRLPRRGRAQRVHRAQCVSVSTQLSQISEVRLHVRDTHLLRRSPRIFRELADLSTKQFVTVYRTRGNCRRAISSISVSDAAPLSLCDVPAYGLSSDVTLYYDGAS